MLKKAKNTKKTLGRPEVIKPEELLERYRHLKQFLEHNWGRIGLELQRVRKPEDVRTVLRIVPSVESHIPFRDDPAKCLLADGDTEVDKRELDVTRQQRQDAIDIKNRLWSDYHNARRNAEEATTTLKASISQFNGLLSFYPFFRVVFLIAKVLEVENLINDSNQLKGDLDLAQREEQRLKEKLNSQSAWFARNEVVRFKKNVRFERNAANFVKAMAGLPEYGWLHSFRKCSMIQDESPTATSYLLFEILRKVVNKAKRLDLQQIELALRDELLEETDIFVKGYIGPNWAYMTHAFAECRGKRFDRIELPYRVFARFLHHLERPKTLPEVELAKREQLVFS